MTGAEGMNPNGLTWINDIALMGALMATMVAVGAIAWTVYLLCHTDMDEAATCTDVDETETCIAHKPSIYTPVYCAHCDQLVELWLMDWDKLHRYECLKCRIDNTVRYGA